MQLLKKILALPLLPPEHILQAFNALRLSVTDATVLSFLNYVQKTWLENSTWSVDDLSVFKQSVRTNNDVEGWHRRLKSRACRGNLPLFMLIKLIHREAQNAGLQVLLLSEGKIRRHTRRRYSEINKKLSLIWARYEAGHISTSRMLRQGARLQLPFTE